MKKLLLISMMLALAGQLSAAGWNGNGVEGMVIGGEDDSRVSYLKTDSVHIFQWDPNAEEWILFQVQYYLYTGTLLTEQITRNIPSGTDAAYTVFTYNPNGLNESSVNFRWEDEWVPVSRYLNEYDAAGRLSSLRMQRWVEGEWIEDRLQQNYYYNSDNQLAGYETIYWRNGAWTQPSVSEQFYNEKGLLVRRVAIRPGGAIDYRIIYEYDDQGVMTRFYTQYPAGDGWSNWNQRSFGYDHCGEKQEHVQYTGQSIEWVPSTRNLFFNSLNLAAIQGKLVPLCHNGNTLWIAAESVADYMRPGDCIGKCLDGREIIWQEKCRSPLIAYPNPANEEVTVVINPECLPDDAMVELIDLRGIVLRSYPVRKRETLIIPRGRLKAGYYYVRLSGRKASGVPVIFR